MGDYQTQPDMVSWIRGLDKRLAAIESLPPASVPRLVTALPANPADGQEVLYLADDANGVVWHLRYRATSGSTHKWEFVGGNDLLSGPQGSITTASTAFVALAGGPSLTLPLAGDYRVTYALFSQSQAAGANNLVTSLAKNGTAFGIGVNFVAVGQYNGDVQAQIEAVPNAAAVDVITLVVVTPNAISSLFNNATMLARPVRVG